MNPKVTEITGSLIREIAAKKTPGCIDLGLGEPWLKPTMRFWANAIRETEKDGLRYTVNAGDPALREAIGAHYLYPHLTSAENVCIMTGSQEAVYVVIKALLDPAKDELLVVEPAFPAYAKMAKLEGAAVRSVSMDPVDGFAFDPERILAAVGPTTRLIVICSPCNPTARVISRKAVDAISEGLLARGGDPVHVLHDEIYHEQTFVDDAGHFAASYPHTIVTNSLSKSNALTGLRLGWSIAPKDIAAAIVKTHAWVTSCASTFAQRIAMEIFSTPGALHEHAGWYRDQRLAVDDSLTRSGLQFAPLEGSFYACVKLPEGTKSIQAAHELADHHGIIAIPGVAFGESLEGWLRLSWVSPIQDVREGINQIAKFCETAAR
ncbi:MAG: pyridoxal phosphate-dependent aminotransferase [Candidatus Baltobacteraceae bacterium]